jgi:hypothetical protein
MDANTYNKNKLTIAKVRGKEAKVPSKDFV